MCLKVDIFPNSNIEFFAVPDLFDRWTSQAQSLSPPQPNARDEVQTLSQISLELKFSRKLVFFRVNSTRTMIAWSVLLRSRLLFDCCSLVYFVQVRKLSSVELEIFKNRWKKAVREDEEWIDPYPKPNRK